MKRDDPLRAEITSDGELVIRIGAGILAFASDHSESNNPYDEEAGKFRRLWRVTDAAIFAGEVRSELLAEEEDGSTPLTDLLDRMCWSAIMNGCAGVEEDGRLEPPDAAPAPEGAAK